MPPSVSGLYTPDADYRTYTNSVFINKTILVPTYREEYDTTALKIYRKALPGYKVVGINAEGMISASGALHCITKEVASNSQLLISHQPLETSTNTGSRTVNAFIKHKTGIQGATLYYRTDTTQPYATAPMTASANNQFSAAIPGYPLGTTVYYYIGATATNGKTMNRPMPGPAGAWRYDVSNPLSVPSCVAVAEMQDLFPNPGKGIVCVPVNAMVRSAMKMEVIDAKGSVMKAQPEKEIAVGETLHFFNASEWPSGIYFVRMTVGTNVSFQKFVRE
jgi:hypothetical protein